MAAQFVVAFEAQVVAPTLEQCRGEGRIVARAGAAIGAGGHDPLQGGDILEKELILEIDRIG